MTIKDPQGDLFNEIYNEEICSKITEQDKSNKDINYKSLFEKFILGLIFLLVFGALMYILGYRAGQKLVEHSDEFGGNCIIVNNENYEKILPIDKPSKPPVEVIDLPKISQNVKGNTEEKAPLEISDYYTIQLVTYKSNEYANKELKFLEKSKYDAFIRKSGKYYIVCVGRYQNKAEANKFLKKMKQEQGKRYNDAYLHYVKK